MKSRTNARPHQTRSNNHAPHSTDGAREHYHREKARRATMRGAEDELIAAAKREYLALLEAEAAKGKGGRPKRKPAAPKHEIDLDDDIAEDDDTAETAADAAHEEADEE